ncbi:RNA polymerase associated protein RapA [hydrothermal vent metagenome]|uniref:RNA polymerase associated protein RapA n=1 Tax=hydrothermal vent metagenome TaxID=652676 RepID=A0A3B0ZM70_9ZZZZ
MNLFVVGQRWVSDTEPELGLGAVLNVDFRVVTMQFKAVDEQRSYAINNAPLSRVRFKPGDGVEHRNGMVFLVSEVEEQQGVLIYSGVQEDGTSIEVSEVALSDTIQFNKPQDRLFAGLIDSDRAYQLRYATQRFRTAKQASAVYGLSGVRTELLPHQMYIAHEVAQRYAPRVLLADEVGLGKTIEAGLILHQQLLTGRVKRVLIVVPESLCFQWLVEMLRRFNLQFSLFDEGRCEACEDSEQSPFLSEQLILCSLEFLAGSAHRQEQVLAGGWDMLIVDEAHHLQWNENDPSPEYSIIAKLAAEVRAILLLTATPDQLGHASHFARLRLLDPDRFYDLQVFLEEEQEYGTIARAAERILENQPLDEQAENVLRGLLGQDYNTIFGITDQQKVTSLTADDQARAIRALLDRHGTGRILFRNSRRTVGGFPKRILNSYPLPFPELYRSLISIYVQQIEENVSNEKALLPIIRPEYLLLGGEGKQTWATIDPRVDWLLEFVTAHPNEKILLICGSPQTVVDLEQAVREHGRIRAAVFHEGLSIVQRDRAAAYFSETEYGAQLLMCSELGSEGRNFQFAHHLVLFDLPLIPDLLEQRIGRLDRIGQLSEIQIHVPYFQTPIYETLFRWYDEGLDAFSHTSAARYEVYVQLGESLRQLLITLAGAGKQDISAVDTLVQQASHLHSQLTALMAQGRDRLLELNSHNVKRSTALIAQVEKYCDQAELKQYVELLFDCAGIEMEDHSRLAYIVKPGSHMSISGVPYLMEEGVTVTFDRDLALSREDILYLSWEHPMVAALMEWVSGTEIGNTSVVVIDGKGDDVGQSSFFLEIHYVVECPAPKVYQVGQYLAQNGLRVVINDKRNDCSDQLDYAAINSRIIDHDIDPLAMQQVVREQMTQIETILEAGNNIVNKRLNEIITLAGKSMTVALSEEIQRLNVLKAVNPNIRDEELVFLQDRMRSLNCYISAAKVRVDALRLIFVSG